MGLSIADIRDAVATCVGNVLESSEQRVNAYGYPPDSPELDALLVLPRAGEDGNYVNYHRSFGTTTTGGNGALCEIGLTLELRVGGGQIDAARKMDLFLSAGNAESVVDALLADPTLAGVIQTLQIGGASAPGWFAPADGTAREWLSSSLALTILARR